MLAVDMQQILFNTDIWIFFVKKDTFTLKYPLGFSLSCGECTRMKG